VHATFAVQDTHAPVLQTWLVPQVVPFAFAAPSTQAEVPVAQLVAPSWQSVSGFVVQATPAVQEAHAPALQTRFVPQLVPFGSGAAFWQSGWPVVQSVAPRWQAGSGFVVHVAAAVQALHVPL